VEKRGLADALRAAGIAVAAGVRWADELRLGLRGVTRRVWAPRGVKIVQPVELRYEWRYLVLAVDGLGGTLAWAWIPNMKATSLAPVVQDWQAAGLSGVVWDGAASHRSRPVREVGLPLVVQPVAAPELNPAERVFEEIRRRVEGRVYATLTDKIALVETYLKELVAAPERLRSLAGWAWIQTALQPTQNTIHS
jgi:hypothetical protein